MTSAAPIASHLAYCRAARRLRRHFVNRPVQLYRGLRRLSDQADRLPRARSHDRASVAARINVYDALPVSSAPQLTPAAMAFIPIIRASYDGAILRYSIRQRLLRKAGWLGIGRFHANLLIALVQHELQKRGEISAPFDQASAGSAALNAASGVIPRLAPLALMVATECLCIAAFWRHLL